MLRADGGCFKNTARGTDSESGRGGNRGSDVTRPTQPALLSVNGNILPQVRADFQGSASRASGRLRERCHDGGAPPCRENKQHYRFCWPGTPWNSELITVCLQTVAWVSHVVAERNETALSFHGVKRLRWAGRPTPYRTPSSSKIRLSGKVTPMCPEALRPISDDGSSELLLHGQSCLLLAPVITSWVSVNKRFLMHRCQQRRIGAGGVQASFFLLFLPQ